MKAYNYVTLALVNFLMLQACGIWATSSYIKINLYSANFWKITSYCSLKPLWSGMGK